MDEASRLSIESIFDTNKLVSVFSTLFTIVGEQRQTIQNLTNKMQEYEEKFNSIEVYMTKLTEKTVGESIGIDPLGQYSRPNTAPIIQSLTNIIVDDEAFKSAVEVVAHTDTDPMQLFTKSTIALTVRNSATKNYFQESPIPSQRNANTKQFYSKSPSESRPQSSRLANLKQTLDQMNKKADTEEPPLSTRLPPMIIREESVTNQDVTPKSVIMSNSIEDHHEQDAMSLHKTNPDGMDEFTIEKAPNTVEYKLLPNDFETRGNLLKKSINEPITKRRGRLMNFRNLSFLTDQRKQNIVKELRVRGHFLKAVREMVTIKAKKDRNETMALRNRIAHMENSIEAILDAMEKQKRRTNQMNVEALPLSKAKMYSVVDPIPGIDSIDNRQNASSRVTHVVNLNYQIDNDGNLISRENEPEKDGDITLNNDSPVKIVIATDDKGLYPEKFIKTIKAQLDDMNKDNKETVSEATRLWVNQELSRPHRETVTKNELIDTVVKTFREMLTNQNICPVENFAANNTKSNQENDLQKLWNKAFESMKSNISDIMNQKLEAAYTQFYSDTKTENESKNEYIKQNVDHVNHLNEKYQIISSELKKLTDKVELLNIRLDENEMDEGVSIRAQLKKVSGGLFIQSEKHIKDFKELTAALQKLGSAVDGKPSQQSIDKMMEMTDATFRKVLGQNITGVNQAVLQIVKAVQRKADKDEITKLIAKRAYELERKVQITLENGADDAAGSTRCLSCGNFSKSKNLPLYDVVDFDRDAPFKALQNMENQDESDVFGPAEFSASLTSSISSAPHSAGKSTTRSVLSNNLSQEPLYRRARHAATMKETVKVPVRLTTPSLPLVVPVSNNQTHAYVLDTEESSQSVFPEVSVHSKNSTSRRSAGTSSSRMPNRV